MKVKNEYLIQLMNLSMDELEEKIKNQQEVITLMEDVFNLRKRNGELTSKMEERARKRYEKEHTENQNYQ